MPAPTSCPDHEKFFTCWVYRPGEGILAECTGMVPVLKGSQGWKTKKFTSCPFKVVVQEALPAESLNNPVVKQLMEKYPQGTRSYQGSGGCETCGHGGEVTQCPLCEEELRGYDTEIEHRAGCSIPLILKLQHEAGFHRADAS